MAVEHNEKTVKELILVLMYLSKFKMGKNDEYSAWKTYDFDILNELAEEEYIDQGRYPTRNKSAIITEKGIEHAKELLAKYGIEEDSVPDEH